MWASRHWFAMSSASMYSNESGEYDRSTLPAWLTCFFDTVGGWWWFICPLYTKTFRQPSRTENNTPITEKNEPLQLAFLQIPILVAPPRLELGTQGSSGLCSTNWAKEPRLVKLLKQNLHQARIIIPQTSYRVNTLLIPWFKYHSNARLKLRIIDNMINFVRSVMAVASLA